MGNDLPELFLRYLPGSSPPVGVSYLVVRLADFAAAKSVQDPESHPAGSLINDHFDTS